MRSLVGRDPFASSFVCMCEREKDAQEARTRGLEHNDRATVHRAPLPGDILPGDILPGGILPGDKRLTWEIAPVSASLTAQLAFSLSILSHTASRRAPL